MFCRQVVARNLLETLRLVHGNKDDVARVISVLCGISEDYGELFIWFLFKFISYSIHLRFLNSNYIAFHSRKRTFWIWLVRDWIANFWCITMQYGRHNVALELRNGYCFDLYLLVILPITILNSNYIAFHNCKNTSRISRWS